MHGRHLGAGILLLALVAPQPARAQSDGAERLQVHGYITQGYAIASDKPTWGIGNSGTFDYRMAAVQFRYALADDQALVVQVNSRKLGDFGTTAGDPTARLEWAFYQGRVKGTRLRFGRLPVVWGLQNEIRDVGTLLPFFRAPATVYWDQVEILNGGAADRSFRFAGWSVDATASVGTIEYKMPLVVTAAGPTLFTGTLKSSEGMQVMVNTPIQGVRIGSLIRTWRKNTIVGARPTKNPYMTMFSGEAAFSWIQLRAERQLVYQKRVNLAGQYFQACLPLGKGFSINAQTEKGWAEYDVPGLIVAKMDLMRDDAGSLKYDVSSNLSFKLEGHHTRGYNYDVYVNPAGPAATGKYMIASVAASF